MCFLICLNNFHKMDADGEETPSRDYISERVKRWSMNSTRLEQIVKELMQPITDLRRNFDTDLSALLEEYLTEAGIHALDADEAGGEGGAAAGPVVHCNFAEVALLLQHSASIYGKKVDYLYQNVLDISENLNNSTQDDSRVVELGSPPPGDPGDPAPSGSGGRRGRGGGPVVGWGPVEVSPGVEDRGVGVGPPPVLPRPRIDLLPRDLLERDRPLMDLNGEPIGLLTDYLTARPTRDGLLVEVLELTGRSRPLRAMSLPPPPLPPTPPLDHSTPLPSPSSLEMPPPPPPGDVTPPPITDLQVIEKQGRKRNALAIADDVTLTTLNFKLTKNMKTWMLRNKTEFKLPVEWTVSVTNKHSRRIRALRCTLSEDPILYRDPMDVGDLDFSAGFRGWSVEAILASSAASRASLAAVEEPPVAVSAVVAPDSEDDDGFFEMSGGSGSGGAGPGALEGGEEVEGWCGAVLATLGGGELHLGGVISTLAQREKDVSRVLLATLLLANAGNVEIVSPAVRVSPTSRATCPSSIQLRVLSVDPAQYSAAISDHLAVVAPAHTHTRTRNTHNRKVTHDSDYSERRDSTSTESELIVNDPRSSSDLHDSGYPGSSSELRDSGEPRCSSDLRDSGDHRSSSDLRDSVYPSTSRGLRNSVYPSTSRGLRDSVYPSTSRGLRSSGDPGCSSDFQDSVYPSTSRGLRSSGDPGCSSDFQDSVYPSTSSDLRDSGYPSSSRELRYSDLLDSSDSRSSSDIQGSVEPGSSGDPQSSGGLRSERRKRKLQPTYPKRSKHRH